MRRRRILIVFIILATLTACSLSINEGDYITLSPDGVWVTKDISNQPAAEGPTCMIPGNVSLEVGKFSLTRIGQGEVFLSFGNCEGLILINDLEDHILVHIPRGK